MYVQKFGKELEFKRYLYGQELDYCLSSSQEHMELGRHRRQIRMCIVWC